MHGMVHHKSVLHVPFAHQKIIQITALLITEDSSTDIIQSQKTEDSVELSQLLVPWPQTSHSLSLILSFLTVNSGDDVLLHSTELWPSAWVCFIPENSYIKSRSWSPQYYKWAQDPTQWTYMDSRETAVTIWNCKNTLQSPDFQTH